MVQLCHLECILSRNLTLRCGLHSYVVQAKTCRGCSANPGTPNWQRRGVVVSIDHQLVDEFGYVPFSECVWQCSMIGGPDNLVRLCSAGGCAPGPMHAARKHFMVGAYYVQQACSARLEHWWHHWRADPATPKQLQQYAQRFKCRDHLQQQRHYLYTLGQDHLSPAPATVPHQLQRYLLRLRTFNLHLACHTSKWRAAGCQICPVCDLDVVEDEMHFLCSCPAYNGLRRQYVVPSVDSAAPMRQPGPAALARFVRAAWKRRAMLLDAGTVVTGRVDPQGTPQYRDFDPPDDAARVGGRRCAWWLSTLFTVSAIVVFLFICATHSWALDAYRVLCKV